MPRQSAGTKARPSLDAAIRFARERIQEGILRGDPQLPSLRTMASSVPVSLATMSLAIRALVDEGVVVCRQRSGVFIAGVQPPSSAGRKLRWEEISSCMEHEILRGTYGGSEALPSIKELRIRYQCGSYTIRRCLAALHERGVLDSTRGHRVLRAFRPNVSYISSIIALVESDANGNVSLRHERQRDFLRTIESESSRRNCSVKMYAAGDQARGMQAMQKTGGTDALGYVIIGSVFPFVAPYFGALCERRRPIAILDETGNIGVPAEHVRYRNWHVFAVDSLMAGAVVGRHLAATGHTNVCFFSPFHADSWSQQRMAGLVRAFDAAGHHRAVAAYVLDKSALGEPWLDNIGSTEFTGEQRQELAEMVRILTEAGGTELLRTTTDQALISLAFRNVVPGLMNNLFGRALREHGRTPWVVVNDLTGVFALEYLQRFPETPPTPPIISFDNSPDAFANGLTSYDFDTHGIATRVVNHLLGAGRQRDGSRLTRCEGTLIQRRSSG